MKKQDELHDPESCFNKAQPDEIIFVLRSKDPAAPNTIRRWAEERCRLDLNTPGDPNIQEAWQCATQMEEQRKEMYGGSNT